MKKINVAFLVCALMALIMCVAPVSALAYEGSDIASAGEGNSCVEEGLVLEGDAENDAQTGNKSPDAGLLNSMRERPARFDYGAGGVEIKPSADLVAVQRIGQSSQESLGFGARATFDEGLNEHCSVQEDIIAPVRSLRFGSNGTKNEISVIDENNRAVANLIGCNYVERFYGGASQQYVYPIDSAGYEAMAKAS
jgi:hypothetical protein